jgi:hypothetical protein
MHTQVLSTLRIIIEQVQYTHIIPQNRINIRRPFKYPARSLFQQPFLVVYLFAILAEDLFEDLGDLWV